MASSVASNGSPTFRRTIRSQENSEDAVDRMTTRMVSFISFKLLPFGPLFKHPAYYLPMFGSNSTFSLLSTLGVCGHLMPHTKDILPAFRFFNTSMPFQSRYFYIILTISLTQETANTLKKAAAALSTNKLGNQAAPKVFNILTFFFKHGLMITEDEVEPRDLEPYFCSSTLISFRILGTPNYILRR
jgi:hypothetical protein